MTVISLYDWNGDGKNDMFDDFIEYQIYKDCTGDDDSDSDFCGYSSGGSCGKSSGLGKIWYILIGLWVLSMLFGD